MNRARFIPSQNLPSTPSTSCNTVKLSDHRSDASFPSTLMTATASTTSELNTGASSLVTSLVPLSKQNSVIDASNSPRPASDCSDDEIIAQRTRTTEIETLYKAKKERGKLNISGLLKRKDSSAKSAVSVTQSATIHEILDDEQLEARSPRQYSNQKLIARPSSHPASASVIFSPPSNQLVAQKASSSRQLLHLDAPHPDGLQGSHSPILSDSNNSHIFTRSSKDEKIKGLTTAFNRKHSTLSRATPPRYASPIQTIPQAENRSPSPLGLGNGFSENVGLMGAQDRTDGRHESQAFGTERGMNEYEEQYKMVEHRGGATKESLPYRELHEKRGTKRTSGSEMEDAYANHAGKRARTENYDESMHEINSRTSFSPQPNLGIDRRSNPSNSGEHVDGQGQFSGRDPQFKFFLGQDVDEYISAHMDRYEAAKKRWADCSREEWEKGADELVEKFTEVLDFVKDHVKRKVTLFASLHATIDQHQKERAQTAEMLKQARTKLVAKAGVVVDEGSSTQHS